MSNSFLPYGHQTASLPCQRGSSSQEAWSRLPGPAPGDFPNPGIEPVSLMSPALAGGSFTTSFLGGSAGKESARNAGDSGSIPGLGRSSGEGNGHPLQSYSSENSVDRGAWWATVHGVTKSRARLSDSHNTSLSP